MNTTSVVMIAALAAIILFGPRLLRRVRTPAQKHVPLRGGVLVMRSPRRYAVGLGICALIPAGILAAMAVRLYTGGRAGAVDVAVTALATLAALAFAVYQLAGAFRGGFVVDEFGLSRVGVLGSRRLRWSEVSAVKYNPSSQWFFVTAADRSHLWIPVDTHGIADFATIALQRLPPQSLRADELAREALEELAQSAAA